MMREKSGWKDNATNSTLHYEEIAMRIESEHIKQERPWK
jgi:hypothetical protein